MSVSQMGSINTTALIVPGLYVQIVPPSISLLNGLPTNILGIVGTATWGPVNAPTTIGDMAAYSRTFGAVMPRKYDMGTGLAAAVLQGANNFRCVRVTDGTDTAASIVVPTTAITLTSKYTGSLGNACQVIIAAGSQASTFKATVTMPGQVPEVFDNVAGTGNAFWVNLANAINLGQSGQRGPSNFIIALAGAGTTAPAAATYTLTGGTDGVTTITGSVLLGVDTVPRKGMYALRSTNTSIAFLADCDEVATFTTQVAYGYSEGTYMIGVTPMGDTITNAVSAKATAGIDAYIFKYLLGDWVYFLDTVNNQTRLISPQGFVAGRLANLSPEQSSLNKPLYGIVGTQKSYQNLVYSDAELGQLGQAGIDLITNPIPAGNSFGTRFGHNSSSNAVTNGDNYTRMTNYIAYTLNASMGMYVGRLQGRKPDDPTRREAKNTTDSFLQNMADPNLLTGYGMIDDFLVVSDKSNNSDSRIALGYMQQDVKVVYLGIVEKFIINVEGGVSVVINRQSTTPA